MWLVYFLHNLEEIERPFVNVGIGIVIETDKTNAIISSSVRAVDTKPSRVVI